jgi:hypothetical protein
MRIGEFFGSVVKAGILFGLIYAAVKWQDISPVDDDVKAIAETACIREIGQRFKITTVRAYAVNENSNGYTVRATVTLARGNTAKVNCLTNTHGGVKDITIEER